MEKQRLDEERKLAAARKLEEERRSEERKLAEAKKREEERQREEERKLAEAKKRDQERLKEEERKLADARKAAEEEKRRAEEERRRKDEAERKLAAEKAAVEKQAAAEKAAADQRAAEQKAAAEKSRQSAINSLLSQAGQAGATAPRGAASGANDGGYSARVASAVRANTILAQDIQGNPRAVFDVQLQPNGRIVSVKLIKSSGVSAWDLAAERAIRRTDPFPCPSTAACAAALTVSHGPRD
ncbi:MAG: cell envelope integrity protein TolA [Lautropia sp.]|nr:cell envelope integrity protein TolA [Lautropia sp.]